MKKIMISLMFALGLASLAPAQNIGADFPTTLEVNTVAVKSVSHGAHDWRAGLSFNMLNFRDNTRNGSPVVATQNFWVLTDTEDFRRLFLGTGLAFNVYESRNFNLGATVGYSGDFSNFERIRDTTWSLGVTATFRF